MSTTVLVGYDGSQASRAALDWAIAAAGEWRARLRVLVAWSLPPLELSAVEQGMGDPAVLEGEEDYGTELLDEALGLARSAGLEAGGFVAGDSPAHALVEASADADFLVVGSRGRGTFTALLLGSVSRQVATHAKCTTVIVRAPADPAAREIVVGVDGSEQSLRALDFAVDLADRRGMALRVLHTWDVPPVGAITGVPTFSPPEFIRDLKGAEARVIGEAIAGLRARYPDTELIEDLRQGGPVQALTEASEHAAMVVVGTRGRGGFLGLVLGSVSHGISHHAHCTVVVVR
jgi:nucleotide-binding universal stress UspA family protein